MYKKITQTLGWLAFAIWCFLTIVSIALWLPFVLTPGCVHPWLIVGSLFVYALPLFYFIWVIRSSRIGVCFPINVALGLVLYGLSEVLTAIAIEANGMESILWQAFVIVIMSLLKSKESGSPIGSGR